MSSYELYIAQLLTREHYRFQQEKTFKDLKGGKYRYDFYLPDVNGGTIIEYDGQYHFHPIVDRKTLKKQQSHDRQKNSYALAHNIPLYRIPYWEIDNIKTFADLLQPRFLVKSKYHNDDLQIPSKG